MSTGAEDGVRVLTVDVGSSSVRAALYDAAGEEVRGTDTSLPHELRLTPPGAATKDAGELFELVVRAVDETLERSRAAGAGEIAAVAFSTFWHGLLGLDGEGHPTTPVLAWADRRSAGAAAELRGRTDEEAVHRRTGSPFHSSYWPAKLLWLHSEAPQAAARTRRWVSPGDYFYYRLFGRDGLRTGTSMASATGLFDQHRREWDAGLPEVLSDALPTGASELPPVSDEPLRGLAGEWARRWPELAGVPWYPALGDGACSNVGSGCTSRDRLAVMIGTSGAMRALWKAESVDIPPGLWCYRSDPDRFVMGGALSDGGNLASWLGRALRLPDEEETERALAAMAPDAHGLTFLPLLAGERGPGWSDLANGTISGLSMSTGPVEILRAAMEAVALRLALIARRLEEALPGAADERRVIASGGGLTGSPAWTRMVADALGRPVTLSGAREASSRGAALLTLEALGGGPIEEARTPLGETYEPDPDAHTAYQEALRRQQRLYEAVLRD
ncbi:MAG: gluconokinase [Rubrobacter sp.]|nr:gluconokinase [Rubrobacter sp.]